MKDSKQRTRHKILGELESIKSLLEDQLDDRQEEGWEEKNPAETAAAEPDNAPLLTEAPNSVIGHVETSSYSSDNASDLSVDDIPVLRATVDEDEWHDYTHDEEDIITRALSDKPRKATASLFDRQGSSTTDDPEFSAPTRSAEQQPSLFTSDHEPPPVSTPPATPSRSDPDRKQGTEPTACGQKAERSAAVGDQAPCKASNATENPFLPKHIRDRLLANRAIQQNAQVQSTKPAETTSSEDTFVDEMVRRYLPKIETELREKIRAMIRDERETGEKSS